MLYIRVGEKTSERKKYDKYFVNTVLLLSGEDIQKVKENLSEDIFGDLKTIRIENWEDELDFLIKLKDEIHNSKNTFLIDEVSVNANTYKKLEKLGKIFDCREEKIDVAAFDLAKYVAAKDKKNAWLEFTKIKNLIKAEEIQGVLFWKFKMLRDKEKMFELIEMRHEAYEGRGDLYESIEKFILKI